MGMLGIFAIRLNSDHSRESVRCTGVIFEKATPI